METRIKTCTKCGKAKKIADFPIDNQHPDGHKAQCRDCYNASRRHKRIFIKFSKRGTKTPMMSAELFDHFYNCPELVSFIRDLARSRARGNVSLEDEMIQAAWIRIGFMQAGHDIECLKRQAERAIEQERKKHWARWYHEGITFQELLSSEEWVMWSSGCFD